MENEITVNGKRFGISLTSNEIQKRVAEVAEQINRDFEGQEVVFIGILNGSFMFAADLMKSINLVSKISFIKVSSYQGTNSTGEVKQLIGISESLEGKNVIVIEDIVDTGRTIKMIAEQLQQQNPASIKIATLMFKPSVYSENVAIDYYGFKIPNDFIVGYGLDYDGYGRNYKDIYTIIK